MTSHNQEWLAGNLVAWLPGSVGRKSGAEHRHSRACISSAWTCWRWPSEAAEKIATTFKNKALKPIKTWCIAKILMDAHIHRQKIIPNKLRLIQQKCTIAFQFHILSKFCITEDAKRLRYRWSEAFTLTWADNSDSLGNTFPLHNSMLHNSQEVWVNNSELSL